jgi:hypothetical protein
MTHKTSVSEMKTLIRKLGGEPRGDTVAELWDQIEDLHGSGDGGGGTSGGDVNVTEGSISGNDLDEIFGE